MTGETPPAGLPELRASHADRDKAIEQLTAAAADGRLTVKELDERVEAALTARTQGELATLVADLPASSAPRPVPKDVVRITQAGGNARRTGPWVVPRRMEIRVTGGNVLLDFTQAAITSPTAQIEVQVRGGNLTLLTRPGMVVDTDELAAIGGTVKTSPARGPQPPAVLQVQVAGRILGGNVRVRPPRRTFPQWLRGWLRPGG